ncbi:MAG: metal-dependent transcriptional regulator [Opitutales bacterium]
MRRITLTRQTKRAILHSITSTVEDYLKAIWTLSEDSGTHCAQQVSLGLLSERLGVTPGTVTTMMRHLQKHGLVDYQPRRGVTLSSSGREAAIQILRRHRIIELFLVRVMKVDWAEVHVEAEALEHAVSDALLARMDEMLGSPTHDPHGDPIPDALGQLPLEESRPLSECGPGNYRVVRVLGEDAPFLNWLHERGFKPGTRFSLDTLDPQGGTLTLKRPRTKKPDQTISLQAARHLLVEQAS